MSAKHTPGPWYVSAEAKCGTIIKEDFSAIGTTSGRLIGSACGYTGSGFFPTDDEARANARLIAAAPDLLEACKAALADGPHDSSNGLRFQIVDQLRAAIAKAEQSTPADSRSDAGAGERGMGV